MIQARRSSVLFLNDRSKMNRRLRRTRLINTGREIAAYKENVMSKKLTGKVALVTGGSRGIGAATALALAEEGADVVISYTSAADKAAEIVKKIEAKGVRGFAVKADQGILAEAEGVVAAAVTKFGKLDILVNNAAVFVTGPVGGDVDADALQRQVRVNIDGTFAVTRAAAKVLPDHGRIITIGSGAGTRTGFPGAADYSATKAAVAAFSRVAARDLASRNITVNTVQAGFVDTDMNPANSDWAPAWIAMVPLGRYGHPEEIAAGVVFLASPDASYVTGTILNIDGGIQA